MKSWKSFAAGALAMAALMAAARALPQAVPAQAASAATAAPAAPTASPEPGAAAPSAAPGADAAGAVTLTPHGITVYTGIEVLVGGEVFEPKDALGRDALVFVYGDTTYAPLRALAEAYGLVVGYDDARKMATVDLPGEAGAADDGTGADAGADATAAPAADATAAPAATAAPDAAKPLAGKVVCLDPGHQTRGNSDLEPVAPGSATKKAKVSSGTTGVATGTPEYQVNLEVALKLRALLEAEGATVVMTRETNDVDVSNVERAQIGNDAGADIVLRIHADGVDDSSVSGISMLVPATSPGGQGVVDKSRAAGEAVLAKAAAATGQRNRGVTVRDDLTGFNWSEVPSILLEMGFMSNADEDRLVCSEEYQDKLARGLCDGLSAWLLAA